MTFVPLIRLGAVYFGAFFICACPEVNPAVQADNAVPDISKLDAMAQDIQSDRESFFDAHFDDSSAPDHWDHGDLGAADFGTTDHTVADAEAQDNGSFPDAAVYDDAAADTQVEGGREDQGDLGPWVYPPRTLCDGTYADPTSSQDVTDNTLREASGLASSPINPHVLWTHNDSGGDPLLFALRDDGTALGRLTLEAVPSGDWEDIASGPCPNLTAACLWVEDHSSHRVYAVVEPAVDSTTPFEQASTADLWWFDTIYPDGGGPDVEALLVEPDGSRFYLFEKTQDDRARIFMGEVPLSRNATIDLVEVGSVTSPGPIGVARDITGGDLHPSRQRLVLRTYLGFFEYRLAPGDFPGDLDSATRLDVMIPLSLEPSGEAVTYDQNGDGLWTISEGLLTLPGQPLHHFACQPEPAP